MSYFISAVAIRKGHGSDLTKSRVLTIAMMIGILIGYIIGNLAPVKQIIAMKILILHGPNLNFIGKISAKNKETVTLDKINKSMKRFAEEKTQN